MRAFVAVGGTAPRWYRSLNEARHDARELAADAEVGDVLARAWVEEPPPDAGGPTPDYELRLGGRGALTWYRTAEEPQPQTASA